MTRADPNPILQTPRLVLRPLRESDADGPYPGWLNDPEVCAGNSHGERPYRREDALDYIRRTSSDPSCVVRAMTLREDGRHVGNIALQRIDPDRGTAELAILIGDKKCWGKGIGEEACRAMIRHAFETLRVQCLHCGTFSNNPGMIALAGRLGFKQVGVREKAALKNGAMLDVVLFELERSARVEPASGPCPEPKGEGS